WKKTAKDGKCCWKDAHEQVLDLVRSCFHLAGQGCVSLVSKPPLSSLITPYRSKKIDSPECWPIGVTKVKLAVSALPQHEARQTHLSTGANDQIGIRAIMGIQEFVECLWGKLSENFLRRIPLRKTLLKVTPDRVDNLLSPPVANANVHEHLI